MDIFNILIFRFRYIPKSVVHSFNIYFQPVVSQCYHLIILTRRFHHIWTLSQNYFYADRKTVIYLLKHLERIIHDIVSIHTRLVEYIITLQLLLILLITPNYKNNNRLCWCWNCTRRDASLHYYNNIYDIIIIIMLEIQIEFERRARLHHVNTSIISVRL